jgi:hypothetical protein
VRNGKASHQIGEGNKMTNPNRHERRKVEASGTAIMTASEIVALDSICAWEGCTAIAHQEKGKVFLPRGWTSLLMFWSAKPVRNILLDISDGDWRRDAFLCSEHTEALDQQLKPLASLLTIRKTQGSA